MATLENPNGGSHMGVRLLIKKRLVKWALPWMATIITKGRYTAKRSRFLDRLENLVDEK